MRRKEISARRVHIQDHFIEDNKELLPVFRKTTRDYHVEKMLNTLQHGAPIGRYSPSYERVWKKAPEIGIVGVADRFGYENKNSPLYVKPAEGQASAMGTIEDTERKRRSVIENSNSAEHLKELSPSATVRSRANKTTTATFNKQKGVAGATILAGSDSVEHINRKGLIDDAILKTPSKNTKSAIKQVSIEDVSVAMTATPRKGVGKIAPAGGWNTMQNNSPNLRQNTMTT